MSARELLTFPPFWLAVALWLWLLVSCVVRPLWMRHQVHANAEEVNDSGEHTGLLGAEPVVRQRMQRDMRVTPESSTSSVSAWQTDKRGTA